MRNGKKRKELYFSRSEWEMIKEAQKNCGLDATNTIRLLINLGWNKLCSDPYSVANNTQMFVKQHFIKNATGNLK